MSDDTEKLPTDRPTLLESIPPAHADPKDHPPVRERDLALGRFMDEWSQLEASLRDLLHILSQAPSEAAFSIAAAIPDLGRMNELLQALGQLYLEKDDQDELAAIGKYLLISTRYRNSIVHGQWGLTHNKERKVTLGVVHDLMWIRIYTLIDKQKETYAALGMDAAAQERFVFTIERLQERAQKVLEFTNRIYRFSEGIKERIRKPNSSA
jgi:hypothetical protein